MKRRRILSIISVQVGITLAVILLMVPLSAGWRQLGSSFLYGLAYSNCIGWLAWAVLPYTGRRARRLKPALRWTVIAGSMAAVTLVGAALALVLLAFFGVVTWVQYWATFFHSLQATLVISLTIGLGITLYETLKYRTRYEMAQARLSSLESRLRPHFLFNTLNCISALIPDDPAAAERVVERLSSLLRSSLDATERSTVPLRHELQLTTDYLEIERTRFGERLRYSVDVPEDLLRFEVPPFSLQTLVENSVKYGGGDIRVSAHNGNGKLVLQVWDSGSGWTGQSPLPEGHGLHNLRARLAALWGSAAAMEFGREHSGTSVKITLPSALRQ